MSPDSEAARTPAPAPRPGRPRARLGALALELFVVFVGVYAAFALTDWDRQRQDDAKRERLERALLAEVRGTNRVARQSHDNVQALLADFEARRLRGEYPAPRPILSETRADPNIWNATVAAGGVGLIDIDVFVQLAGYYNAVQAGLECGQTLKRLSEQQLIARQGEPAATFYQPGTRDLRPEYAWYPDLLRQIESVSGLVAARGDSVIARLEAGLPR